MVKGVSVLRKKAEEPVTGKLPFDADRSRRVSYSDYSLPPIGFLNQAPPLVSRPTPNCSPSPDA